MLRSALLLGATIAAGALAQGDAFVGAVRTSPSEIFPYGGVLWVVETPPDGIEAVIASHYYDPATEFSIIDDKLTVRNGTLALKPSEGKGRWNFVPVAEGATGYGIDMTNATDPAMTFEGKPIVACMENQWLAQREPSEDCEAVEVRFSTKYNPEWPDWQ